MLVRPFSFTLRVGSNPPSFQVNAANALSPPVVPSLPKGFPDTTRGQKPPHDYVNTKSVKTLGLEYRPLEETIRDTLLDFKRRGWC